MVRKMVPESTIMMKMYGIKEIGIEIENKEKENLYHLKDNIMDYGIKIEEMEKVC